jgi:hypothetical protein
VGSGQKVLCTDAAETGILDVRELSLAAGE